MISRRFITIVFFCITTICGIAQDKYDVRQYSIADGLPSNLVSCAEQDDQGLLWFGTWRGLCCFDGYEFISFDNTANPDMSPLCTRIHLLKPDANYGIWLVTYDRRAYRFNTRNSQYTDISDIIEERVGYNGIRIRNVYALKNGVVWLTCYDDENHAFRITINENKVEITDEFTRLAHNCGNLRKVVLDSQGNEWLETDDGSILKWQAGTNQLKTASAKEVTKAKAVLDAYSTTQQPKVSGLDIPDNTKRFIDKQNNVWTLGNNLIRYTPQRSLLSHTPEHIQKLITRQQPLNIYAQLRDSKGRVWQGYKGSGLTLNGKPFNEGLEGKDVFDIFEDSHGHIWVACYDGGFNLIDDNNHTPHFINTSNGLKGYPKERHEKVRHITETSSGVIILSTASGIVCFSSDFKKPEDIRYHAYTTSRKDKESIPGGNVMQVLEASNGKIYISTMTGGLTTITSGDPLKDDLRFAPVEGTKGSNGIVLTFIEDNDKCLWLARENHLERFDTKTGKFTIFGKQNFGGNVTFSEAMPVKDPETGEITMGLLDGTMTFDPKKMNNSDFIPRMLFSSVQYQGSQERQPILYAENLDVPANRRNLTIYFSALDYQDNDLIQYAYMIEGVDKEWTFVGRNHCASFNNLPCGHLRLLVKSTNADGVWVENTAVLKIYSHPTFFETGWAWLLYICIVGAIVYVAIYIVQMRQRHRREREEMERKLEQLLASLRESSATESSHHAEEVITRPPMPTLPPAQIEDEEKKMMEHLMAFLDENLSNADLKIADLADAVNMSRSVFYERIKSITGMSPVDFLRYLRIQRAKQILTTNDMSISQVAYETGFSEANYFGKVFKKATGLSPKEYRLHNQSASI